MVEKRNGGKRKTEKEEHEMAAYAVAAIKNGTFMVFPVLATIIALSLFVR